MTRVWNSEELCTDILVNNAGGRVVKLNDKIYISTGYFTPYIFSGIILSTRLKKFIWKNY